MAEGQHADDPSLGHEQRGVSVHHLRGELLASLEQNKEKLFEKMKSRDKTKLDLAEADVADIEEIIIRGKGKDLICPRDKKKGAAYVDSIFGPENAGLAKFMLSYTWRYKIKDIVDTLDSYCSSKQADPKKTYIWICCLCINQWRVQESLNQGKKISFDSFQKTFGTRVEKIGHVLAMMSPWKDPQYTSRVWCDFELFTAVEKKTELEILMPPSQAESLHQALLDGSGIQEVWRALMRIDISKADASVPEDKQNIFQLVQKGCGFETLNLEVSKRLRIWIVERCFNDVEKGMKEGKLSGEKAVKMCSEVGNFLTDLGQYPDAAKLLRDGLDECTKRPSLVDSLCHAEILQSLGDLNSKERDYEAAITSFNKARQLREKLNQFASEEGAELMRCIGLTYKHSGKPDGAWKCYEEAYELRKQTGTLNSEGAADLLRSMGALKIDHHRDPDAALEMYMQAMEVRRASNSLDTPGGSYLMMCVGIVKAECLDSENAVQIYEAAERIRERTGTLDAKTGKYLQRKIREAELDLHVHDLVHAFSIHDSSRRNGCFPVRVLARLLNTKPSEVEKMLKKFPGLCGKSTAEFSFKQLLMWLYPDSLVAKALVGGSTGAAPMVGCGEALAPAAEGASRPAGVSLLVWNIQSPEYCPNALEFLPGNNTLSRDARLSLRKLKTLARKYMLHPTETKTLEELLPDDRPLKESYLTPLEKAPLTDAKTLKGLTEWLQNRREAWKDLWPQMDAEALTKEWAAKPEVRWKYWKRQRLVDWLCDDSSGGKMNPLLLPAKPSIDDLCWNLGLSSADRKFPRHPARSRRACWIQLDAEDEDAELPQTGKFDFFKLLVWDLLLAAIMEEAMPTKAEVDVLLDELKRTDSQTRMGKIVERVSAVDVAVCMEVPSTGLPNVDDFWVVDSSSVTKSLSSTMTQELHTAILARKSLFSEPVAQGFYLDSGAVNPRVLACTLRRLADGAEFHIVAVHMSGKGEDFDNVMPKVEEIIRPNTVLAGDFNVDLRKKKPPWLSEEGTPRLDTLVRQAKAIELQYGTSNKQRSPFQAQVSKMFFQDFSMKDFAFLGEAYYPSELHGLITRSHCLPDAEIPSDHAPVTLDLVLKPGDAKRPKT